MSNLPSPLKSATAMDCGKGLVAGLLELKKLIPGTTAGSEGAPLSPAARGAPFATPPQPKAHNSVREKRDRQILADEVVFTAPPQSGQLDSATSVHRSPFGCLGG